MNLSAMKTAMSTSISEVMEQMVFTPIDHIGDTAKRETSDDERAAYVMSLDFHGTFSGTFRLWVADSLAESIAADFLGENPGALSIASVEGSLKEMINMLGEIP